jgi:hypothetical protein
MSDLKSEDVKQKATELHGILWLASYPKSGNTWTRNFLHNLLNILEGLDEDVQDINKMNELTFWEISAEPYEKLLGKPVTLTTRQEIAEIRPQVQELIASRVDGLAMIKTHHCLVTDRGHPVINTKVTAGAVYIVRNPLDVAISLANHISGTIDDAIDMMETRGTETLVSERSVYEVYGSWSQHVESWTRKPHQAIYVMRYEQMLEDPERTFGALARHLLLKPREDQLRLAIERSSFENLRKQEEEGGFKEKPEKAERFFRSGKSGEWQDKLTRRQVRQIVSTHHQQMERFGYLTEELKHIAG